MHDCSLVSQANYVPVRGEGNRTKETPFNPLPMYYKGVSKACTLKKSCVYTKGEGSGSQGAQAYLNCDVNALHLRLAEAIAHVKAENITRRLDAFMDALEVVNAVL